MHSTSIELEMHSTSIDLTSIGNLKILLHTSKWKNNRQILNWSPMDMLQKGQ